MTRSELSARSTTILEHSRTVPRASISKGTTTSHGTTHTPGGFSSIHQSTNLHPNPSPCSSTKGYAAWSGEYVPQNTSDRDIAYLIHIRTLYDDSRIVWKFRSSHVGATRQRESSI